MRQAVPTLLIVAGLVWAPVPAGAQAPLAEPATPALWDGSLTLGQVSGQRRDLNSWNRWCHTGVVSVEGARYWTPHVKTTLSVGRSGEGRLHSQRQVAVPGQSGPVLSYEEHFFQRTHVSGSMSYQFFENAWVHPYVTAGLQHVWERDRIVSTGVSSGRLIFPPVEAVEHRATIRPLVGAGAKLYLSPRAFVRPEIQVAQGPKDAHITASVGVGLDLGWHHLEPWRPAPGIRVSPSALDPNVDVWRAHAQRLPTGSRIAVRLRDGSRLKATLVDALEEEMVLQPKTRVSVPVRRVDYAWIESIELDGQTGMSAGKAIGIGVASGTAAFVGMLLVMVASLD